ncbi:MAG: GNAT family N-acetyltransferase [Gemmatimonadales bacterium]
MSSPAPFELQPTLHGALVRLEPLHEGDFERLHAVAADPLIWEQHPEHDRGKREVFQRFFDGAMQSGGAFLVVDATTGVVIGSTRYCGLDPHKSVVEIGWTFLARSHWGGRHNGEMKGLMLAHAFRFVERVVFVIGPENVRSRRAVEKIGGRPIAPRKNAKGEEQVVYEITRAAFGG